MDPITMAIVAAIAAGVTAGATEVGKQAIVDAYSGLKTLLKDKFGNESEVVKSVEGVEKRPESDTRKELLKEEVSLAKADKDPDIVAAAQALLDQLKAQPGGEQHIQTATGSYIAQADRGGMATVSVNQPQE